MSPPGFEPGLPRPQRGVLTTIRWRLKTRIVQMCTNRMMPRGGSQRLYLSVFWFSAFFTSLRGHRSGHGGVESESVPGVLLLAQRETALASRPLAAVYIWLFRESSSHLRARERSAHCNNGETGHKPLRGLALLLTHGGVGCPLPRMRVSLTFAALLCTASLWRRSPRARFALVLELNRAERRIRVQSPAGIGALAHSVGGWARSVANLFPARKSRQE